jgi:hypothetical protein
MSPRGGVTKHFAHQARRFDGRDLQPLLLGLVGQPIGAICRNGFDDPEASHCAHFVSHLFGLDFGCTCADLTGGTAQAGNVRVHEIFAHCWRVGPWADADPTADALIFVSRESAFDAAARTMINIPNKHIGIYCAGDVFHYSSRHQSVLKKSVNEFLSYFEAIYGANQVLFFGYMTTSPPIRLPGDKR